MDNIGSKISLQDTRYSRFESIQWWDQEVIKKARILVVGAGALGNEVLKNLALLGIGKIIIVDMDTIEKSNLSRSILFRESDEHLSKAECAAKMITEINPGSRVFPLNGNIMADIGLGYFLWADIIIGALDNREARVFVNSVCARLKKPWIDGGIEVLHGIVRGFHPPVTPCYECTMSNQDWKLIQKRRSCSLLARLAAASGGTPTTPTMASIIGGIQVQEVLKSLHGLEVLYGRGYYFDGLTHSSYIIQYQVNPECFWHAEPPEIKKFPGIHKDTPLKELARQAGSCLGGFDALDFAREIVKDLTCVQCGYTMEIWKAEENMKKEDVLCGKCHTEMIPGYIHSIEKNSEFLEKSPCQAGLPDWDIVWARAGNASIGIEITGDNPFTLPESIH